MKPRGLAASHCLANKSSEPERDRQRDARDARASASIAGGNPRRHQKKPRSQSLDAASLSVSVSAPADAAPFLVPADAAVTGALQKLSLGPTTAAVDPVAADSFAIHFPPMATTTPHANDLRIPPAVPPHLSANASKPAPAPANGWKLVKDMTFSQILARSVAPSTSTSTTQTAPFSYAAVGASHSNNSSSLQSASASFIPHTAVFANSRAPNKSKPKNVTVGTMTNVSMGEYFGTGTLNLRIVPESMPFSASVTPVTTPLYLENVGGSAWKSTSPPTPLTPLTQPNIAAAAAPNAPTAASLPSAMTPTAVLPAASLLPNSQLNNFIILQQQYQQSLIQAAAEAAAAASLTAGPLVPGSSQIFRQKKLSAAAQPFVPSTFDTDSPRRSRDDMVDVRTPGAVTRKLNMQSRHSRKRNDTFDYYYSEDEDHERGATMRDTEQLMGPLATNEAPNSMLTTDSRRHRDSDAMSIASEDSVEFVLNEEGTRSLPGFLQAADDTVSPTRPPPSVSARSLSARPKEGTAFKTHAESGPDGGVFARHRSVSMDEVSVPPVLAQRARGMIGGVGFAGPLAFGITVQRDPKKAAADEGLCTQHATLRGLLLDRAATNQGQQQQQQQSHRRHTHTFQRKQSRNHMRRSLSITDVRRGGGGGGGLQVAPPTSAASSGTTAEAQTPSMTSSPGGSAASTAAVFAGSGSGRFEFSKRWSTGANGKDSVYDVDAGKEGDGTFGWSVGPPPTNSCSSMGGNASDGSGVVLARTASEPYLVKHRNPAAPAVPGVMSAESNSTLQGIDMEIA